MIEIIPVVMHPGARQAFATMEEAVGAYESSCRKVGHMNTDMVFGIYGRDWGKLAEHLADVSFKTEVRALFAALAGVKLPDDWDGDRIIVRVAVSPESEIDMATRMVG